MLVSFTAQHQPRETTILSILELQEVGDQGLGRNRRHNLEGWRWVSKRQVHAEVHGRHGSGVARVQRVILLRVVTASCPVSLGVT